MQTDNHHRTRATLLAIAVFAAAAAVGGWLYLRSAALSAREQAGRVSARVERERELAAEVAASAREEFAVSEGIGEARSSQFLEEALREQGITPQIDYGDPQPGEGRFRKVETTVRLEGTELAPVIRFMQKVQSDRSRLTLLRADIRREDEAQDSWTGSLTYGALIPARPRS